MENSIEWGKQNIADLTLQARDLEIRWTNQGKQFPAPSGTVNKATWIGAGYPDYPWLFGTDAEYTAFAAVSVGQFDAIKGHLRALREISDILNDRSGVVTHEVVADGSIWFGHDSRHTNPDGTTAYDFNTDETVKFPSTVALVWRWTGDHAFLDENYDFAYGTCVTSLNSWTKTGTAGLRASAMSSDQGWVRRSSTTPSTSSAVCTTWPTWRSTRATSKPIVGDRPGGSLRDRFDDTWWYEAAEQYADSLEEDNSQSFQKHWIGQTPMEAELLAGGQVVPGLAPREHGTTALAKREDPCYSGSRPFNLGLFHTGCGGGPTGQGEEVIFGLTTSIQSIGEGNYGRLGPGQQQRYTHALAETMFSEPATGDTPDEQPGAMPEIFPSPDQGPNIDRCWTCRSMFMQAWGNYGTAWAVVHQWLGVRPQLGRGELAIVPQVPSGQSSVSGDNILIGKGSVDVEASHTASRYTTEIDVQGGEVKNVVIGHTLPRGATIDSVSLDGVPITDFVKRETNRGIELTVPTDRGRHILEINRAG